jgi:hypothetical protein
MAQRPTFSRPINGGASIERYDIWLMGLRAEWEQRGRVSLGRMTPDAVSRFLLKINGVLLPERPEVLRCNHRTPLEGIVSSV